MKQTLYIPRTFPTVKAYVSTCIEVMLGKVCAEKRSAKQLKKGVAKGVQNENFFLVLDSNPH